MSSATLLEFLNNLNKEFENTTAKEKRLEYNLLTHTFSYDESTFTEEMIKELKHKNIRITQKRKKEIIRLAGLFSTDLWSSISGLKTIAKNGITKLSGNKKSFSFVFTTDIRTGKTPSNWAKGEKDVFDKIKRSYSTAYRKFFFGIKDTFEKGSKARENFKKHYNYNEEKDVQTKGKMGHSGHAEGEGIIETMTREFFDKHANEVLDKATEKKSLTEDQLLKDLKTLDVDLTFMRSTKDMTQRISLIGAGGNILSGAEIKEKLKTAMKRIKKLIDNPKMVKGMNNLEGSDSFMTIKKKQLISSVVTPLKTKVKGSRVRTQNIKVKHSKKTVKITKKSSGKKANKQKSNVKVAGLASLAKRKPVQRDRTSIVNLIGILSNKLENTVAKNMREPALVYRSGDFARSVEITDVAVTPQGFPSIGYTYDKYPYQTFEPGYVQGSPERDPRRLIDASIREIAMGLAIGRFYTRRV